MSPRVKTHKGKPKLAAKFGTRSAIRMSPMGGDVRSGQLCSLRGDANSPDADEVIFLIGKDHDGFWVAREEYGCAGGRFFTERGALQFAKRWANPRSCTTVRVSEPMDLDFGGDGDALIPLVAAFKGTFRIPAPLRDVLSIVLGLAAVAISVWLMVMLLTLGR